MYYVKMFLFFPFLLSVFVQKSRATLLINQMLSQDKKNDLRFSAPTLLYFDWSSRLLYWFFELGHLSPTPAEAV